MPSDASYDKRAARMQSLYEDAYPAFLASLTPEERARIEEAGLDAPLSNHEQVSGRARPEIVEAQPVATTFNTAASDTLAEQIAEHFQLGLGVAGRIAAFVEQRVASASTTRTSTDLHSIVGFLLRAENVKTSAAGLAYAVGLADLNNFGPIRSYARQHGLSPAAVSKQTIKWQELLRLPPSVHSKPKASRQAYSEAQKKAHWRGKKFKTKPDPSLP